MPTYKLGYLSHSTKRTGPSASHLEELCLCSAPGHTCVPCDLLSSTDLWVQLETLQNHPWPGTTAEMIAALHAVTGTDAQMVLKTVYSLTSVCLRAWQDVQPYTNALSSRKVGGFRCFKLNSIKQGECRSCRFAQLIFFTSWRTQ